jgi:hypothetical protein
MPIDGTWIFLGVFIVLWVEGYMTHADTWTNILSYIGPSYNTFVLYAYFIREYLVALGLVALYGFEHVRTCGSLSHLIF